MLACTGLVTCVQLASGFLVEVGNPQQDKFIFDLGTGAYINLWATGVPFSKLNKVGLAQSLSVTSSLSVCACSANLPVLGCCHVS